MARDLEKTLRFTSADFDAYRPEHASAGAVVHARRELGHRMLDWARSVVARLGELGVGVEVDVSDDEASGQYVVFWRGAAARARIERLVERERTLVAPFGDPAPYQRHAFLALRVDSEKLEVGVHVHADAWVDARNLRARLADPGRTLELTSALEALPEQFTVGFDGDAELAPAAHADGDVLRSLLDRAESQAGAVWIGWSVPRDVAITHAVELGDQLEDALVALGPIFRLVAWAPDNDLFDLAREAKKPHASLADEEVERERESWSARRVRESLDEPEDERERWSEPSGQPEATSTREPPLAPIPIRRALARRAPTVTEVDPALAIEKGSRVQVLAGPFEGKVGVVHELDGKGAARVMLGLLAARLEVKDLIAVAEGKERPALASSHRRPLPAR